MERATSPARLAEALTELWSPRVIGTLDDCYVKVAKLHGQLMWHSHADEDELFYVLAGELKIELESGVVHVTAGQFFIVPKGVRHNPIAEEECLVMLLERKSTKHTGDALVERTRSIQEQLRPL